MGILRRIKWKFQDFKYDTKANFQIIKKGYANRNCWNFYGWYLETIPKMIRELRDMKHGAPEQEFKEIDNFSIEFLELAEKEIQADNEKNNKDGAMEFDIQDFFTRWRIVLTRIAWCLEQADEEKTEIKNELEEEWHKQIWGDDSDLDKISNKRCSFKYWWKKHTVVSKFDKNGKPLLHKIVMNDPDPDLDKKFYAREMEIYQYRKDMLSEAFNLMNKYFYNLWD